MLTDRNIQRLRPRETRYRVTDADGLILEVMPSGRKFWRLRIRHGNATKVHTLGEWPELSVYDARLRRDKIRQDARPRMTEITFFELAEEWFKLQCDPSVTPKRSIMIYRWLEKYVYPKIGDTVLSELAPLMVLDVLRPLEERGLTRTPHYLSSVIGQILRYGVITEHNVRDVTADLRGALKTYKEVHFASLKSKQDIGDFLRAVWNTRPSPACQLMKFVIYTFVRSSEARLATWDEFDIENAMWKIPAQRMKAGRPHMVPLSHQALEIVKENLPMRATSKWVFPSPQRLGECLNHMILVRYMRSALCYRYDEMTVHGLRSIASTTLYEHGWDGIAIERQLAHSDRNSVRAAYNYAEFLDVRKNMMQWYADYLDDLRNTPQNA